ncbi:MAG: hypothetical protein Q8O12_05940 [Candidatus Omnitrophota bacterium]|nr:hypothetical protein [Candidatus Omnitrophota bacterium]
MKGIFTIPKRLTNGKELVVVPKDVYERLVKHDEEVKHALKIITQGEKDYKEGRALKASSLREALKIYAAKPH